MCSAAQAGLFPAPLLMAASHPSPRDSPLRGAGVCAGKAVCPRIAFPAHTLQHARVCALLWLMEMTRRI